MIWAFLNLIVSLALDPLGVYGAKYSSMDQVNFVKDNLQKILKDIYSNFLKAVFHKFDLVHSWILYMLFKIDNRFFSFINSFFKWYTNTHFSEMIICYFPCEPKRESESELSSV